MSEELRIKDLLSLFRLDWVYDEKGQSTSTQFVPDTSIQGAAAHIIRIAPGNMMGYQVVVDGDILPGFYDTILEAKQAVEQQLAEDYPNYGSPSPEVF